MIVKKTSYPLKEGKCITICMDKMLFKNIGNLQWASFKVASAIVNQNLSLGSIFKMNKNPAVTGTCPEQPGFIAGILVLHFFRC
jgi:hypothetical protein